MIKLYGDLREKATQSKNYTALPTTLQIELDETVRVIDILNKLNISQNEVSHVFVNNKYSGLEKEIKKGDRIGIFPKRMGIIFIEIKNPF